MRAFIALTFSSDLKKNLASIQKKLKPFASRGRWVYVDNFHMTMKFLGVINPELIEEISKVLEATAKKSKKVLLSLGDLGYFPGKDELRVLYVNVLGEIKELLDIQHDIDLRMKGIGFAKEKREFRPHITLGRNVSFDTPMHSFKDKLRENVGYKFVLDNLVLMKSEEIEGKRIYTPISSFQLKD